MEFNFEEFEKEFNEKYKKRKEPPSGLVKKWEENSKKFRDDLLKEEFVKEVAASDVSEMEFKLLHTALLSIIPDLQTQIDLLRERIEKLENKKRDELLE
jgi:hypothetical protein